MMTRGGLASLKVKALRRQAWFALSRLERGVVELTIRNVLNDLDGKVELVVE